jgi:hypothetical protein
MRKLLFISVGLFFASMIIVSCKKSDSTSTTSSGLVGSWALTSDHGFELDTAIAIVKTPISFTYSTDSTLLVTFNSNSTYFSTDKRNIPPTADTGTYVLASGKITIIPNKPNSANLPSSAGYVLSGNTLTVYDVESDSVEHSYSNDTLVFTRQ